MPDRPIPAVIYAAKSTGDPRGSIPTQLDDCRAFAEAQGWEIVGQFNDEGFSAYSGNRGPDLERAKRAAAAAAECGEAYVVVQHTDRLARGAGDAPGAADSFSEIWHALARQNVRVASVQNPEAASDPIYAALAAKMSHDDSKRKSAATRAGKRRRAERGEATGPLQFGYRLAHREDGEGKDRIPDPDEAPVVLHMFAMLDEGRGIGDITRWLNGQGVKTKRGNTFGRGRVRDILRNPWYGGRVKGYGDVREGKHEPLLPWDEFERISAKLDRGRAPADVQPGATSDPVAVAAHRGGRRSDHVALLSGVMFCAHCGHGIWHRKGARLRYLCGNVRHATGVCDAAPFDAQATEDAVLAHLSDVFIDFDAWLGGVVAHRLSERDGQERELAAIRDRRQELDRDVRLVRGDYMKSLRAGNDAAGRIAAEAVEEIERERDQLDATERELAGTLEQQERASAEEELADFWQELSTAIRERVVNAGSVREANAALRERFAAIFVRSAPGGSPRLDFVLRDREPGAPLVTTALWADSEEDSDGEWLVAGLQHATASADHPERLTLV